MSIYTITQAAGSDSHIVGEMIYEMEKELWESTLNTLDKRTFIDSAYTLIQRNSGFWAFLANDENLDAVGVITLSECRAIYAGGMFGEIMEIYIRPDFRSCGIGNSLIDFAKQFAKEQHWPILEVGAPEQPRWSRTLNFYTREGFRQIGPRLEIQII